MICTTPSPSSMIAAGVSHCRRATVRFNTVVLPDLVAALESDDEWLARNASLAIARHGKSAGDFVEQLQCTVAHPNRYVQANALKALQRIDTPASRTALIDALQTSRWCPITTPKTPY
ncbi:MAG TPA: hypothetical protein DGN59_23750 [Candidatus Latescibacteria bacterium]|nr:hypothetical protein [Candidatus Latescibacterota bacterium]